MTNIKINEQIAFLRKQKGLTQEELAKSLGVTNQAVSKWESAQCCPDIALLPDIAKLFEVSVDELMGYKGNAGLGDICLKIKNYFTELPEKQAFENAYRIAALLHEIACTDGYKRSLYWNDKDYISDDVSRWGTSVCSEPEGSTARMNNCVFFSLGKGYRELSGTQLRKLAITLEQFSDVRCLKVMYALYGLTINDFDVYVPVEDIAKDAGVSIEETEEVLKEMPVTLKETDGRFLYRLDGAFCHIPPMLSMLWCDL